MKNSLDLWMVILSASLVGVSIFLNKVTMGINKDLINSQKDRIKAQDALIDTLKKAIKFKTLMDDAGLTYNKDTKEYEEKPDGT